MGSTNTSLGSVTAGTSSTGYVHSQTYLGNLHDSSSSSTYFGYYTNYFVDSYINTTSPNGFSLSSDLLSAAPAAIADLENTGSTSISMALFGDVTLTQALLTLDVTAAVPEPSTLALICAGLFGVSLQGRRKKYAGNGIH